MEDKLKAIEALTRAGFVRSCWVSMPEGVRVTSYLRDLPGGFTELVRIPSGDVQRVEVFLWVTYADIPSLLSPLTMEMALAALRAVRADYGGMILETGGQWEWFLSKYEEHLRQQIEQGGGGE
jgi:hypothetical protein